MDVLVQVNAAEEESKFGITAEETGKLIQDILDHCPHIRIKGLMCIAPFEDDPEDVRIYFREVKELYDKYAQLSHPGIDFQYLSMGMSHDYEAAIMEGSNLIRVGTAIFGERDYSKQVK
jgi:pyridoxal phosphate enzyme (YggS family)